MKKEYSRNDVAAIKRAAANIAPFIAKKNKFLQKRMLIDLELKDIQRKIDLFNMPIKEMTGFNITDLVEKKNGTFVLKYPDTLFPDSDIIEDNANDNITNIDDTEKIDEIETSPADAPFKPQY